MSKAQSLNAWVDREVRKDQALQRRVEKKLDELKIEQQLLRLREKEGLSQTQLAKRLGVSQPFVAKMESGRVKKFNINTLAKAADALGYTLRVNFERNGHATNNSSKNGHRPKSKVRRSA
jgi:transcriptional regulator with XRE-family HTH domain